ncbi:hypothetical protein BJ684DRAFT_18888 [Piptocephalis cylindrospora]|uniref:Uncharacterized protein n=1 Tax=Piptocephalis cylindrospora TaxID=1907219 RepID=A0A4P9Y6S1_9FUNG|nr:hypothetical protein BJ684DRAFT_18888 [Piptocephalis cylindrospora]|eukprot:RKP14735.1 hypothetical protein BJ684DRAFT_18888 [Piptocephalis cylindrospora]
MTLLFARRPSSPLPIPIIFLLLLPLISAAPPFNDSPHSHIIEQSSVATVHDPNVLTPVTMLNTTEPSALEHSSAPDLPDAPLDSVATTLSDSSDSGTINSTFGIGIDSEVAISTDRTSPDSEATTPIANAVSDPETISLPTDSSSRSDIVPHLTNTSFETITGSSSEPNNTLIVLDDAPVQDGPSPTAEKADTPNSFFHPLVQSGKEAGQYLDREKANLAGKAMQGAVIGTGAVLLPGVLPAIAATGAIGLLGGLAGSEMTRGIRRAEKGEALVQLPQNLTEAKDDVARRAQEDVLPSIRGLVGFKAPW